MTFTTYRTTIDREDSSRAFDMSFANNDDLLAILYSTPKRRQFTDEYVSAVAEAQFRGLI